MKIYKTSQNIQYLDSIGVPSENTEALLAFVLSLEGDARKIAMRTLRKNPNSSVEQLNASIKNASKESHLEKQGLNPEIVKWATQKSEKYSVWLANAVSKWIKSVMETEDSMSYGFSVEWMKNDSKTKGVRAFTERLDPFIDGMLDWIQQNEPNLSQLSLIDAQRASDEWHEELANKEVDQNLEYSTHDVVFQCSDGWEIVKLSGKDCGPEGELMGHCFAYGTKVRTYRGFTPIEKIKISDRVLCEDGTFRPVIKLFRRHYCGDAIKLSTRLGVEPIVVTPEHEFKALVPNAKHTIAGPCRLHTCGQKRSNPEETHDIAWTPILDVGEDGYLLSSAPTFEEDIDEICIPIKNIKRKSKGAEQFKVNELFLWIIGIYIAEGSSDGDKLQFALSSNEAHYASKIKLFFEQNGYHCWERKNKKDYNGLVVKVSSRKMSKWFKQWLGDGCENKSIPHELLNLPKIKLKYLVQGILDGDNYKKGNVLHQTSPLLALQIVEIGLKFGNHIPTISIQDNSKRNRKTSYSVDGADPFIKRNFNSRKRGTWTHNGMAMVQPYEFKKIHFEGDVYNIEVDEKKSYTVQNILVHNCVGGYSNDVSEGRTQIYSLRDPKDRPHATIEMTIPSEQKKNIYIDQIQGKGNEEPIPEYKEKIKQWFDSLQSQGYQFDPLESDEGYEESITVENFQSFLDHNNEYGIKTEVSELGGGENGWFENLKSAYNVGNESRDYYEDNVYPIIDNLINYVVSIGEIYDFDKAVDKFNEWADDEWFEYEGMNAEYMPEYPQEEEFNIENENGEEEFDQEAYNEALSEYDQQISYIQNDFPPLKIMSHLRENWDLAFEAAKQAELERKQAMHPGLAIAFSKKMTKFSTKESPTAEEIATYIESLNIFLENGKVKDKTLQRVIERLPYPDTIRLRFSEQECNIVFDTICYLWKKLTGKDLVTERSIQHPPKGLEGNYWMMTNGVILEGPNHFTIVKRNINLFSTLLNISSFVIHEKLSSKPDSLIKTIIDNGGMRIFISTDKRGFFQLSDETYSKWGRDKIKGFDLKDKTIKVVDPSTPYNGWESGVLIKVS